jgi:membrane associated rhomboid family serine protease
LNAAAVGIAQFRLPSRLLRACDIEKFLQGLGLPMPPDESTPGRSLGALRAREPIFDAPPVVIALVAVLLIVHGCVSWAPEQWIDSFADQLAFVPARLTLAVWPEKINDLLVRANLSPEALRQARILREYFPALQSGPQVWTLLSYAFLHATWSHVGLNAVWIVAFGPPVARRVGPLRFLALFAVTAIAGAVAHWALNMVDVTPLIGASAADSGLMAAATRFMFEPGGPLGGSGGYSRSSPDADYRVAAPPLRQLLRERRVVIFLIIWLATNFIFGAGAQTFGVSEAPVAWLAHMGGFAAGFFLFPLFDRRAPALRP